MGIDVGIGTGTEALMSSTNPMPIVTVDGTATGTITATDASGAGIPTGTGLFNSTAPTAASFVSMTCPDGSSAVDIQILGTATGTYVFEHSIDNTNWIPANFRQSGIINTQVGFTTTTIGLYRGTTAGMSYLRVRNVGGTTPSNAITMRSSSGTGSVFLNGSLPAGTNAIGTVANTAVSVIVTDISVVSSGTTAQLLATNSTRRGLILNNTDANECYLYYGTTATATRYTVRIPSGGYWEMPDPKYTGRIDVMWAAAGSGRLIGNEL